MMLGNMPKSFGTLQQAESCQGMYRRSEYHRMLDDFSLYFSSVTRYLLGK